MPELPEVETVRRSLDPALLGCRVVSVQAHPVKLRVRLDAEGFARRLPGARLHAVTRLGKYLMCRFDSVTAVIHLGMSGRLVVRPSPTASVPHTHLVLGFEGGQELHFVDPRRFGLAVLLDGEEIASFRPLTQLGPDALAPEARVALVASARASRAPIHALLLDQGVIAGVGNIYASEALHRAGIRPDRRASGVSGARLTRLASLVQDVLGDSIASGGTTLGDGGFVAADGSAGYYAVRLDVYGRAGEACRRCSGTVQRRVVRDRSVYFCPRCQR